MWRCDSSNQGWLSLSVGLALHELISALLPDAELKLRWPNDLLLAGQKLAGILVELHEDGKTAIVGLGLNLKSPPEGAAGLGADRVKDRKKFASEVIASTKNWLFAAEAEFRKRAYLQRLHGYQEQLEFHHSNGSFLEGRLIDIDSTGALCLRLASGRVEKLFAGAYSRKPINI